MSSEQKKMEMSLLPNFISTRAHWRWRCSGTKTKNDPFVEPFFWHQYFWRLQKRFFVAKSKKKEYMSTKKAYANVNLKSCHCKVSWCIFFLQHKKKKSSPKPKDSLLKNWYLYLISWNLRSISFCNSFKEISILKKSSQITVLWENLFDEQFFLPTKVSCDIIGKRPREILSHFPENRKNLSRNYYLIFQGDSNKEKSISWKNLFYFEMQFLISKI